MGGGIPMGQDANLFRTKGALMIELVILAVVVAIVILVMQPWRW